MFGLESPRDKSDSGLGGLQVSIFITYVPVSSPNTVLRHNALDEGFPMTRGWVRTEGSDGL